MVLYENADALDPAIALCKRLVQEFEGDIQFQFTWWGFRYLDDPAIAGQAAQAGAAADLIVVSSRDPAELPSGTKTWFERWIPQRRVAEGAMVLIPAAPKSESPDDSSYLEGLARRANMDFFPVRDDNRPEPPRTKSFGTGPEPRIRFEDFPQPRHPSSGWGINE